MVLRAVARTLETSSSPSLCQIVLIFPGDGFRVRQEEWGHLDRLLASEKFSGTEVQLVVPFSDITVANESSEEDLTCAKAVFPQCDVQGRLSLVRAPFETRTGKDQIVRMETFPPLELPTKTRKNDDREMVDWACRKCWV